MSLHAPVRGLLLLLLPLALTGCDCLRTGAPQTNTPTAVDGENAHFQGPASPTPSPIPSESDRPSAPAEPPANEDEDEETYPGLPTSINPQFNKPPGK